MPRILPVVKINQRSATPGIVRVKTGGGSSSDFLSLQDTPSSYSGQSGKVVSVKNTEDGLEFTTILGDSASKNIGTSAGTVAAGDHNHTGVYAPVLGSDDNYVTDAEKVKLSNLSGTNTGDQTITLTGEATGTGTSSFTVTLTNSAVIGKVLTGLSLVTSQVIAATDTVLQAFGYLQAQITALTTVVSGKVASSRSINTTAPLSGGGDLSSDRTLTTSMATGKLIGRGTAGTGVMEEITLGTNLSLSGTTLNAAGGGGGGTPGGSDTQIQYNNSGSFGGMILKWISATKKIIAPDATSGGDTANGSYFILGDGDTTSIVNVNTSYLQGGDSSVSVFDVDNVGSGDVVIGAGRVHRIDNTQDANGSSLSLFGGYYSGNSLHGGNVDITAGSCEDANSNGGDVNIIAGNGNGDGFAGDVTLMGGNNGGSINIYAGEAVEVGRDGGSFNVTVSSCNSTGENGTFSIGSSLGEYIGSTGDVGDIVISPRCVFAESPTGHVKIHNNKTAYQVILDIESVDDSNKTFTFPNITGTFALLEAGQTFTADISVPDEAYGAGWNGSLEVPTKNAIYDKIETLGGGSGITRTVVVTSGSATMGSTASVDYVYFVAGAHTMSLPAAAGNTNRYTIKNNHSASITIDTVGVENIEGASSISLSPADSIDALSDGTNWFIV